MIALVLALVQHPQEVARDPVRVLSSLQVPVGEEDQDEETKPWWAPSKFFGTSLGPWEIRGRLDAKQQAELQRAGLEFSRLWRGPGVGDWFLPQQPFSAVFSAENGSCTDSDASSSSCAATSSRSSSSTAARVSARLRDKRPQQQTGQRDLLNGEVRTHRLTVENTIIIKGTSVDAQLFARHIRKANHSADARSRMAAENTRGAKVWWEHAIRLDASAWDGAVPKGGLLSVFVDGIVASRVGNYLLAARKRSVPDMGTAVELTGADGSRYLTGGYHNYENVAEVNATQQEKHTVILNPWPIVMACTPACVAELTDLLRSHLAAIFPWAKIDPIKGHFLMWHPSIHFTPHRDTEEDRMVDWVGGWAMNEKGGWGVKKGWTRVMITTVTLVGQSWDATQGGGSTTSVVILGHGPVPYTCLGDTKVFPAAAVHATGSGADGDDKLAIWWGLYGIEEDINSLAEQIEGMDLWDRGVHRR